MKGVRHQTYTAGFEYTNFELGVELSQPSTPDHSPNPGLPRRKYLLTCRDIFPEFLSQLGKTEEDGTPLLVLSGVVSDRC